MKLQQKPWNYGAAKTLRQRKSYEVEYCEMPRITAFASRRRVQRAYAKLERNFAEPSGRLERAIFRMHYAQVAAEAERDAYGNWS